MARANKRFSALENRDKQLRELLLDVRLGAQVVDTFFIVESSLMSFALNSI